MSRTMLIRRATVWRWDEVTSIEMQRLPGKVDLCRRPVLSLDPTTLHRGECSLLRHFFSCFSCFVIMAQFTASLNLSALFQGIILNFRLLVGELLDAARVLLTLVCCGASGGRKWRERSLRTAQARSSSRVAKIRQVPLSFLCLFLFEAPCEISQHIYASSFF